MKAYNYFIDEALSGKYSVEVMGPHFTKYHLSDGQVLHHFTADDGGAIHDHPWSFETTILRGGYIEEIWTYGPSQWHSGNQWSRETHYRREGEARHVDATAIHSIVGLLGHECWTLVTPGPWERDTRFYRIGDDGMESRQWDQEWTNA